MDCCEFAVFVNLVDPDGNSVVRDFDIIWRVDDLFDAVQFHVNSSLIKLPIQFELV